MSQLNARIPDSDHINTPEIVQDLRVYLEEYLKKYRFHYSNEENASYLLDTIQTIFPKNGRSLTRKQRWNKIADMKKLLGQSIMDIKEGWFLKAKGAKQILWERGLYHEKMFFHQTDSEKSKIRSGEKNGIIKLDEDDMIRVLAPLPDFRNEKPALQKLIE